MPFLVLECLEGRTIEGLLAARDTISTTDAIAVGLQLAAALAAVHQAGVVHRDVKPSNVFVTKAPDGRERIKLVDFGIARLDRPGERKISLCGAFVGTPEYMSPEQLLARGDVDLRSDVYALGATLFECVTGKVPYSGTYAQILLKSASPQPTPSVMSVGREVPQRLAAIIDRALCKPREDRFQDMDGFAAALLAVAPSARRHTALLSPPVQPIVEPATSAALPAVKEPQINCAQRRRCVRAAYVTPVRIIIGTIVLDGRSEDISEGGMLVLCRGECPVDRPISIRFASPIDGRVVTVDARVRWVKGIGRYDQAQRALGVEFDAVPDDLWASISRYTELMGEPGAGDAEE
jgi:serine/threonine-protein kinase